MNPTGTTGTGLRSFHRGFGPSCARHRPVLAYGPCPANWCCSTRSHRVVPQWSARGAHGYSPARRRARTGQSGRWDHPRARPVQVHPGPDEPPAAGGGDVRARRIPRGGSSPTLWNGTTATTRASPRRRSGSGSPAGACGRTGSPAASRSPTSDGGPTGCSSGSGPPMGTPCASPTGTSSACWRPVRLGFPGRRASLPAAARRDSVLGWDYEWPAVEEWNRGPGWP